ncbi:hypothetical protein Pelo_9053 [Pelomyxa schiedti]|nr:hypothetical protein Pelo_9053 [Pelomyxa schiedti]
MPPHVLDQIVSFVMLRPHAGLCNFSQCSRSCLAACERSCLVFRVRAMCRAGNVAIPPNPLPGSDEILREVGVRVGERKSLLRFLKRDVEDKEWQMVVAGAKPMPLGEDFRLFKRFVGDHSRLEAFNPRVRHVNHVHHRKNLSDNEFKLHCFGAIWFYSPDHSKKAFIFCNGQVKDQYDEREENRQIGFCCVDAAAPTPPAPPHRLLKSDAPLSAPWIPLAEGSAEEWDPWRDYGPLFGSTTTKTFRQLMERIDWQLPRDEEQLYEYLWAIVALCGCRPHFQW